MQQLRSSREPARAPREFMDDEDETGNGTAGAGDRTPVLPGWRQHPWRLRSPESTENRE